MRRIQKECVRRRQVGLVIDGDPLAGPNTTFWTITRHGHAIGKVTSAIYSPRLHQNIALAMVATEHAAIGTEVKVDTGHGPMPAKVVERPFHDPKKQIAKA